MEDDWDTSELTSEIQDFVKDHIETDEELYIAYHDFENATIDLSDSSTFTTHLMDAALKRPLGGAWSGVEEDDPHPVSKEGTCWYNFTLLFQSSPRDLWFIYLITFLDSLSYFMFSYVLILHLTKELGMSDQVAGVVYGVFGVTISVFAIGLGGIADRLKVRKNILITSTLACATHLVLAVFGSPRWPWFSALVLFLPFSFAVGLSSPVIPTAIRRYTTKRTSDFAFSLFYVIMNLGAVLSAPVIDIVRIHVDRETIMGLRPHGFLIFITALLEGVQVLICLFTIRDVDLQEDGVSIEPFDVPNTTISLSGWWSDVKEVWKEVNFRKFIVMSGCLVWVKSTFRYLDSMYPLYIPRVFGPQASHAFPYMSLLGINPLIVICLTVPAMAVVRNFHPITAITLGSVISGLSPFFMAIGAYWWAVGCFITTLSLGEIVWSPISYDYTCRLAPQGKEGMFFALSGLPMFGAKLLTGPLSGLLLTRFCPDPDIYPDTTTCSAFPIWMIIGATTIISPIALLLVRSYITIPLVTTGVVEEVGEEIEME